MMHVYLNAFVFIIVLLVSNVCAFNVKVAKIMSRGIVNMNYIDHNRVVPRNPIESSKQRFSIKNASILSLGGIASIIFNSRQARAESRAPYTESIYLSDAAAVVKGSVVVLGSGGKTGKLIVQLLAKMGIAVTPTSRDGSTRIFEGLGESVKNVAAADVTKIETLENAISGASAVIFAASASRNGGNAEKVDYLGVENVARECVRLKIPRLVVISSGAITRPNSLGFKITNLFGRIMEYKLKGEEALKDLYSQDPTLSYIIVRPGGLLDGNALGPSKIELNQGDAISGEIDRADVAECAVAAALSKTVPKSVTFEIYRAEGSGPLEGDLPQPTGYEQSGPVLGGDYEVLFKGLKSGNVKVVAKK